MNEIPKTLSPQNGGGNPGAKTVAPVAAQPKVQPAPVAVAAGSSVPLFGGHRGGGKKRKDGLVAGSPEAKAADLQKDRERKNVSNAAKRSAALPPPLPSVAATVANATPAATGNAGGVPPAPGVVGIAPAGALTFVPWTQKILQKPARLLTRILDRARQWDIFRRLDKTTLPAAVKDEIKRDAQWKEDAQTDFADALADCGAIELNRWNVSSQHAHWITLGMSAGELALAHITLCGRIDELILKQKLDTEKNKNENANH